MIGQIDKSESTAGLVLLPGAEAPGNYSQRVLLRLPKQCPVAVPAFSGRQKPRPSKATYAAVRGGKLKYLLATMPLKVALDEPMCPPEEVLCVKVHVSANISRPESIVGHSHRLAVSSSAVAPCQKEIVQKASQVTDDPLFAAIRQMCVQHEVDSRLRKEELAEELERMRSYGQE